MTHFGKTILSCAMFVVGVSATLAPAQAVPVVYELHEIMTKHTEQHQRQLDNQLNDYGTGYVTCSWFRVMASRSYTLCTAATITTINGVTTSSWTG